MRTIKAPPVIGEGSLLVRRQPRAVSYSISTSDQMKTGKGSVLGLSSDVEEAFLLRDVQLTLTCGKALNISFLGHTQGSDTAYFEIRHSH